VPHDLERVAEALSDAQKAVSGAHAIHLPVYGDTSGEAREAEVAFDAETPAWDAFNGQADGDRAA
jgi:hypothetical protein